jgi:hypothetical protein
MVPLFISTPEPEGNKTTGALEKQTNPVGQAKMLTEEKVQRSDNLSGACLPTQEVKAPDHGVVNDTTVTTTTKRSSSC